MKKRKKITTKIVAGNKKWDFSYLIVKDKKTGETIHKLRLDGGNDYELYIEKLKVKYLL